MKTVSCQLLKNRPEVELSTRSRLLIRLGVRIPFIFRACCFPLGCAWLGGRDALRWEDCCHASEFSLPFVPLPFPSYLIPSKHVALAGNSEQRKHLVSSWPFVRDIPCPSRLHFSSSLLPMPPHTHPHPQPLRPIGCWETRLDRNFYVLSPVVINIGHFDESPQ